MLVCTLLPMAALAQYRPDWSATTLYEEVSSCRGVVVSQAIKDFEQKGLTAGHDAEKVRAETISMTPVLEVVAVQTCPCAINEITKDIAFSSYKASGWPGGVTTPRCCSTARNPSMPGGTRRCGQKPMSASRYPTKNALALTAAHRVGEPRVARIRARWRAARRTLRSHAVPRC
jgi:hypothetical protein